MSAVLERAAQGGVGGLHQRDGFGDRDGLVLLAGLNCQVNSNFMANLNPDALTLNSLEPFGLYADRIVAGGQVRSVICAGIIRGRGFE